MVDWRALTEEVAHRPWPLPRRPWVMTMSWLDLLFAHWRVEPGRRRLVAGLRCGKPQRACGGFPQNRGRAEGTTATALPANASGVLRDLLDAVIGRSS